MKRWKLFKILLFFCAFIAVERFCRSQTAGFRFEKASSNHTYPFNDSPQDPPVDLHQPFYFLGSGVQFYAFIGEDQQTVLKLFKHHRMGLPTEALKTFLPRHLAAKLMSNREKKMVHLFESVQIAYDDLTHETGLFYTHLSKTVNQLGKTPLYDKLGIRHILDLDRTEFLLQKRAQTVCERLEELFQAGKIDQAIVQMKQIIDLIAERSKKGIKNKDGNILENCGFIGGTPIELDIGSYIYRTNSTNPDPHQKATLRATLQLLGWVKKNYPEYLGICKRDLIYEKAL